jgi:hypothetical protein
MSGGMPVNEVIEDATLMAARMMDSADGAATIPAGAM